MKSWLENVGWFNHIYIWSNRPEYQCCNRCCIIFNHLPIPNQKFNHRVFQVYWNTAFQFKVKWIVCFLEEYIYLLDHQTSKICTIIIMKCVKLFLQRKLVRSLFLLFNPGLLNFGMLKVVNVWKPWWDILVLCFQSRLVSALFGQCRKFLSLLCLVHIHFPTSTYLFIFFK